MLAATNPADFDHDDLTLKYRLLFEYELVSASETGTFDAELWQFTQDMFDMTVDNTQDIEGLNSIIKHVVDLAPRIELKTLSARVQIKKMLGSCCDKGSEGILWHQKSSTRPQDAI
jgi:hypothetical protein